MDDSLPEVNWEALDYLVLDFVKSERLLFDPDAATAMSSTPPHSPSEASTASSAADASDGSASTSASSYRSRVVTRQIRQAIESGDIDTALELLHRHAPAILADHRILFRLQKQKFLELLRKGTDKDRKCALDCLRTTLAPCALDAYPEAYEEFKHVLLALIFDKYDPSSPVASEWSDTRRLELAGLLSSTLTAHLCAYDPIFVMTLKYLVSIHKMFCAHQSIETPTSHLTEMLLFDERDPQAMPHESLQDAPPFDEVDIQALAHAVDLPRQRSIDSLKYSRGNLFMAFQNELCRMKGDMPTVDKLVHEYCLYRGIVVRVPISSTGIVNTEITQESKLESLSYGEGENGNRLGHGLTNLKEDCSVSDISHQEYCFRSLRRHRNCSSGQGKRKRWRGRGRIEKLEYLSEYCLSEANDPGLCTLIEIDDSCVTEKQDNRNPASNNYESILELKEMTCKGMAAEVVEEINYMFPDFFTQNPPLLFQLKQVEFLKLVSSGDHSAALQVASKYLAPLASSSPCLLKLLKETMMVLIQPDKEMLQKAVSLSVLANSLQAAMSKRLGIEEPQLMKIMREMLHVHTEWFKLQMCKDPFEHFLKIDSLKDIDSPVKNDTIAKNLADDCGNGSSQITTGSSSKSPEGQSSPQTLSGEVGCSENAILKVMEFLAMPRADAIHLLMQYNGNAETVIQQIFL